MNKTGLLSGKVAIITGASRGIGKAIADRFAEEGAIVYANSLETENIDEWASQSASKNNTSVIPLYFDITDAAAAKNAVLKIKKEQGQIDVLVNNAGLSYNELIGMVSIDKVRSIFEVNVFALLNLLQIVARIMTKQERGSIINISSLVGIRGNPGQIAYAASKGAVIALTKSAAKELAGKNIRVNSVAPGLTDTEMFRLVERENLNKRIANIGMGRLAEPREIADACVFLASDLSTYVSGQILGVDGSTVL
jgi:3-oxoacyl-[acyl-carrier protein] reductase